MKNLDSLSASKQQTFRKSNFFLHVCKKSPSIYLIAFETSDDFQYCHGWCENKCLVGNLPKILLKAIFLAGLVLGQNRRAKSSNTRFANELIPLDTVLQ